MLQSANLWAEITTQVNPSTVFQGQPFQLILTTQDKQAASITPDLTPLTQDFTVVGTERSMSYTVVNGQAHGISQWTIALIANKPGLLTIPSIQIGNQQSKATTIEITTKLGTSRSQQPNTKSAPQILLKTDVNQQQPYINQQVIFRVKLFNNGRLLDAQYIPPQASNALLIALGDIKRYQDLENGHPYMVEEQTYALFPQKSGEIKITGPSFNALVYEDVPEKVQLTAKAITLKVKPVPANLSSQVWFPAKQVLLREEYDKNDPKVLQGNTITRTVHIEALAMPGQLIPIPEIRNEKGFNAYPGKTEVKNIIKQNELVGKATFKITYLLNQAGQTILPPITIPWFNIETGKEEQVTLPSRMLEVVGTIHRATPSASSFKPEAPITKPAQLNKSTYSGVWWLLAGFLIACLLFVAINLSKPYLQMNSAKKKALMQLQVACKNNNPVQAKEALLRWANLRWPDQIFIHLTALSNFTLDPALKKQLDLLSEVLYSQKYYDSWHGAALWESIKHVHAKKVSNRSNRIDLPPINPL